MNLYIIRHGETDWNKERRLQGQSNPSLNDYGRELAVITGEALKDVVFDYVYSSPLNRSMETAKIILGDRDIEIKTDDRLKEISFGEYEGVPAKDMPADFTKQFFDFPESYVAPRGGESYESLCKRTNCFLEEVIRPLSLKEPEANVVIFGHGAMNKSILVNLQGLTVKDMWSGTFQKNCCVNIFDIKGKDAVLIQDAKIYYEEK